MRFLFIKNEQTCYYCGAILSYGEEAVVVRIGHYNGVVIPQFFHTDQCYEAWNSAVFVGRLLEWRQSATERPKQKRKRKKSKMGRPKKYTNGVQARRIVASLYFHRKAGNEEKIVELETKLKEVTYACI